MFCFFLSRIIDQKKWAGLEILNGTMGSFRRSILPSFGGFGASSWVALQPDPWNVLEFHLESQPVVWVSAPCHYLQIIHSFELASDNIPPASKGHSRSLKRRTRMMMLVKKRMMRPPCLLAHLIHKSLVAPQGVGIYGWRHHTLLRPGGALLVLHLYKYL